MRVDKVYIGDPRVDYVGARMRAEDAREITTATGLVPLEALARSVSDSTRCFVVLSERQPDEWTPIAIFGSAPSLIPGYGVVWFLSTNLLIRETARIRADAPEWLEVLGKGYTTLHNLLDARNVIHLRWCIRLGFEPTGVYTVHNHPFIHIVRHV